MALAFTQEGHFSLERKEILSHSTTQMNLSPNVVQTRLDTRRTPLQFTALPRGRKTDGFVALRDRAPDGRVRRDRQPVRLRDRPPVDRGTGSLSVPHTRYIAPWAMMAASCPS